VSLIENKQPPALKILCPSVDSYTIYTEADKAENEFKVAVKAHEEWTVAQRAVEDNKAEYNTLMMGGALPSAAEPEKKLVTEETK
jgi:hypothetical protein